MNEICGHHKFVHQWQTMQIYHYLQIQWLQFSTGYWHLRKRSPASKQTLLLLGLTMMLLKLAWSAPTINVQLGILLEFGP